MPSLPSGNINPNPTTLYPPPPYISRHYLRHHFSSHRSPPPARTILQNETHYTSFFWLFEHLREQLPSPSTCSKTNTNRHHLKLLMKPWTSARRRQREADEGLQRGGGGAKRTTGGRARAPPTATFPFVFAHPRCCDFSSVREWEWTSYREAEGARRSCVCSEQEDDAGEDDRHRSTSSLHFLAWS